MLLCAVPTFVGQLPELAAAHPEAYASFVDCSLRSHMLLPIDMMLAYDLLEQAHSAVLGPASATANRSSAMQQLLLAWHQH
jgi:hypothetical protein